MSVVTGYKWGNSVLGTEGGVVTWSIAGGGIDVTKFHGLGFAIAGDRSVDPNQYLTFDFVGALRQAFNAWSLAAGIDFIQVADSNSPAGGASYPDIRIFFGNGDGTGGVYDGLSFYPGPGSGGDIFFDLTTAYNSDHQYLRILATHEIGHALGLGHELNATSLMAPWITVNSLQPDDIAGIRTIYGMQDHAPEVYSLSPGQANITVLYGIPGLTINGNANPNSIVGSQADETILGFDGDDVLSGGGGNDRVDGGAGFDTGLLSFNRTSALVDLRPDHTVVVTQGAEVDVFSGVERIKFGDGVLRFDVPFDADAALVYRIYQASFARTPDEAGFVFWQGQREDQGLSFYDMANFFRTSPEFVQKYGANVANNDYVYSLYGNVLQRTPDIPGLQFWQDVLNGGALDRNELMLEFAKSPENVRLTAPNIDDGYWLV